MPPGGQCGSRSCNTPSVLPLQSLWYPRLDSPRVSSTCRRPGGSRMQTWQSQIEMYTPPMARVTCRGHTPSFHPSRWRSRPPPRKDRAMKWRGSAGTGHGGKMMSCECRPTSESHTRRDPSRAPAHRKRGHTGDTTGPAKQSAVSAGASPAKVRGPAEISWKEGAG